MLGNNHTGTVRHTSAQGEDQEIQGSRCTNGSKRIRTDILSYNDRIHHIIQLLKDISY